MGRERGGKGRELKRWRDTETQSLLIIYYTFMNLKRLEYLGLICLDNFIHKRNHCRRKAILVGNVQNVFCDTQI